MKCGSFVRFDAYSNTSKPIACLGTLRHWLFSHSLERLDVDENGHCVISLGWLKFSDPDLLYSWPEPSALMTRTSCTHVTSIFRDHTACITLHPTIFIYIQQIFIFIYTHTILPRTHSISSTHAIHSHSTAHIHSIQHFVGREWWGCHSVDCEIPNSRAYTSTPINVIPFRIISVFHFFRLTRSFSLSACPLLPLFRCAFSVTRLLVPLQRCAFFACSFVAVCVFLLHFNWMAYVCHDFNFIKCLIQTRYGVKW